MAEPRRWPERAYRRLYTVDIVWTGDPTADWSAVICNGLLDGNLVLCDVNEGQLHELCEHASEADS
jgi:hypothetical protein